MSMNRVTLIGNLGDAPDLRYTPGGQPVCDLRVATTEKWTDREGEKKEETSWHSVTVFGKQAENCSQYLRKGSLVCVEGRIQYQTSEKDGVKKYFTKIIANPFGGVQFLDRKGTDKPSSGGSEEEPPF